MDWREGHIKLFMSHLSLHKTFVDKVARHLLDRGVDGFVAHRSIKTSRKWEGEIQEALDTCEASAISLHEGFSRSPWTEQEVGYCLARDIPIVPLDFCIKPYGFMRRYQAAPCVELDEPRVADVIYKVLLSDDNIGTRIVDAMIESLARSESFDQANRRAKQLRRIPDYSPRQLEALKDALSNDQVSGGIDARRVLGQIFAKFPLSRRWVSELLS